MARLHQSSAGAGARNVRASAASTGATMLAVRPPEDLQRQACTEELANQRFRVRDVDADVTHLNEGDKQIDVVTEHVVELCMARRHVRVSDAARSFEVEALRLRVCDVARRRARVTDQENVMNVLTEQVRVSDVVTRRVTATLGACCWQAVGRDVHTDSKTRERVEFGDAEVEDSEPIVTMPEEQEREDCPVRRANHSVTFEELVCCCKLDDELCEGVVCYCELCPGSPDKQGERQGRLLPGSSLREKEARKALCRRSLQRKKKLQRRLSPTSSQWTKRVQNRLRPMPPTMEQDEFQKLLCPRSVCDEEALRKRYSGRAPDREEELQKRLRSTSSDRENDLGTLSCLPGSHSSVHEGQPLPRSGQRKWSKRNRQSNTGAGIFNIRQKHNRTLLQYRQARARGTCCRR